MMRFSKFLTLATCCLALGFSACKKDPAPNTDNGKLELRFEHFWGDQAFAHQTSFTTASGQAFTPTRFAYYVTNISLIKEDDGYLELPETYYLVEYSQPSSHQFQLRNIPAGRYKGLRFMLGVDSTRNVSGAQVGALDPANAMFWSWNSGYIFLRMDGSSAASTRDNGAVNFHLGGFRQPHIGSRWIEQRSNNSFEIHGEKHPELHYKVQVKNLFNNIDLSEVAHVHSPNETSVRVADNLPSMFMLDHVHE